MVRARRMRSRKRSSPCFCIRYSIADCPILYTMYPPACSSGGRYPVSVPSRTYISAFGSMPSEKYSAMPSANHSGTWNRPWPESSETPGEL